MRAVCIDFETYYDDEVSVTTLGNWAYVHHPSWHPLLMAVSDGETNWAGPVDQFNWEALRGALLIAHNAGFDRAVLWRLIELGQAPEWLRSNPWQCTSSLSAYLANVRSLKEAVYYLRGRSIQKTVREALKKISFKELVSGPLYHEAVEYARQDATEAFYLWDTYHHKWPTHEQELATMTYDSCSYGVAINTELLGRYEMRAREAVSAIEEALPWTREGLAPSSPRALTQACRDAGIPVPPIKTEDPEEFAAWEATYGPRCPWVRQVSYWRQLTRFLRTLETIRNRLRPDNTIEFSLLYFGAHTGRWSGGGAGLNMQNLRKRPLCLKGDQVVTDPGEADFALDIRALFVPRPGKKFIIADLSQIEPRVLNWLCGNHDFLQLVGSGMNMYEAFARKNLGWKGGNLKEEDPKLYLLAKCEVLGLGYGCGAAKFASLARSMGLELSDQEAAQIVTQFRASNPGIVNLWNTLERGLRASLGGDFEVELPSGRVLRYKEVGFATRLKKNAKGGGFSPRQVIVARVGHTVSEFYGGLLCENLVQAAARDVFAWHLLQLRELGKIIWHVHDEVILEVDPGVRPEDVVEVMSKTPEWLPGCPVAAEAFEAEHYCK